MSHPLNYEDSLAARVSALLQLQLPGVSRIPDLSKADLTPEEAEPETELEVHHRRTLDEHNEEVGTHLSSQQFANLSTFQQRGEADLTPEEADPEAESDIRRTLDEFSRVSILLPGRGYEVPLPPAFEERHGTPFAQAESTFYRDEELVEKDLVEGRPLDEDAIEEDPVEEDPVAGWQAAEYTEDGHIGPRCESCLEHMPAESTWEAPCEHRYCSKCLERMVGDWYPTTRPPMCCGEVFPWDDFKARINEELAAAVEIKKEELDSRDRTY